jgi:hypothetical protein
MKSILSIAFLLVVINGFSQDDKVYKSLDEALKNAENVIHLDLSGQGLTSLPKGFKNFKNMKSLDLSKNKLTSLPSFAPFDILEKINLSDNPLSEFPIFIEVLGEERNVISENNSIGKFSLSNKKAINITEKDFEGTICISSTTVFKSETANGETFLKVMPDGLESERWLEIRKKGDFTNESLLQKMKEDKTNQLECFFNKHITFDKQQDTLPFFLVYNSVNKEGKVGMVGSGAMVFFDKYYITLKSKKRHITYSEVKKLLESALTFRPESENLNVQFSKKVFKEKTADDFLVNAKIPIKVTVPGVLPELTPTKETIYTLQPGETVAFTNEYQLGTSLKDKEYYLYYKKAGKYYVKTAKNVFGPYDDLPTARPDAPFSQNFTAEFKAIKNKKAYFISNGVETGPYPEDAYMYFYEYGEEEKKPVVRYGPDKENYIEIEGKKYGPYSSYMSLQFCKGKRVLYNYSYNKPISIYVDDVLKFKDINIDGYSPVLEDDLFFSYIKDEKKYLQFNEQSFGPYDAITRRSIVNGKLRMWYKENGKQFYYIDGKVIGPYDEIMDHYSGKILNDFVYKNEGKFYITIDGKVYGPYDTKPTAILDSEGNFCYHSFMKEGKEYFVFKGKQYGPFEDVLSLNNSLTDMISKEDKQPFTMTKNVDGTFSVFTYDKNYLSIKSKPDVFYSDSLNKIAMSFSEKNTAGENEFYLLMDDVKYGPFAEITSLSYVQASYTTIYSYRFLIKTKEGKVIRMDEDGIWGPFDKFQAGYDKKPNDKFKLGDYWYINNDQKLIGPITNVSFMDQVKGSTESGSITMQGKNVSVDIWGNDLSQYYLNNIKLDKNYVFVGYNDINFILMTYDAGLDGGYVINNKFIKDKGLLNYAWDEESKTAFWLSLEGKNVVRYKLKL